VVGRIVEAILVGQQGIKDRANFQELMPILVGACQATGLQTEDNPDLVQSHLRQQRLKARSIRRTGSAMSLVFIDQQDTRGRPTQLDRSFSQGVLALGGLAVIENLLRGRLADVNDGFPTQVTLINLSRGRNGHKWIPRRTVGRAWGVIEGHETPPGSVGLAAADGAPTAR
jgi:hypothetical protein